MRRARTGTICVFAVLATATIAGAALASPPRWGIDAYSAAPGFIDLAESAMGRSFSSYAIYTDLDSSGSFPKMHDGTHAIEVNALIYLNINSYVTVDGEKSVVCWPKVADGRYDTDIRAWILKLKELDYSKIIVTFNHEPNVTWNPHQPKCPNDDAPSYKHAFRHMYHMFRHAGLDYRFAFVTTAGQFRSGGAYAYMPMGDFQVVGADGYNQYIGDYKSPKFILSPVHDWAVSQHMPLLIGELGCLPHRQTAAWVASAATLLRSYGDVIAVEWNNNPMFRLDQRPDTWLEFLAASALYR